MEVAKSVVAIDKVLIKKTMQDIKVYNSQSLLLQAILGVDSLRRLPSIEKDFNEMGDDSEKNYQKSRIKDWEIVGRSESKTISKYIWRKRRWIFLCYNVKAIFKFKNRKKDNLYGFCWIG